MVVVALTGGIGAGKSLVADELVAGSVTVVDADVLAREVVAPGTPGIARIAELFGAEVIGSEGNLDRGALAHRVFGDAEARKKLEAIIHPLVAARSRDLIAQHLAHSPETPVVYVVPLLVESGRTGEFEQVVLIDAPRKVRIDRLVEHRGMTREEATSRVDAQASDEQRRLAADTILDASRSREETRQAAAQLAQALWDLWPDKLHQLPPRFPVTTKLA